MVNESIQLNCIVIVICIYRARKEGRIYTPLACRNLINRMLKLRGKLLELINYQRVFVPLSYTQVNFEYWFIKWLV